MNNFGRNLALWAIIIVLVFALFNLFQSPTGRGPHANLAFSEFLADVEAGRVREVTIQGNAINGYYENGQPFSTYAPDDANLVDRLTAGDVRISAAPDEENVPTLFNILVSWFPMLLLIGVWIFFMRQMQSGGGKAMGFGKSRAKLLTEKIGRVTFDDVAGIDEAMFSNKVSARFEVETFNGDIDNCFGPQAERSSRYSPGLELSFTVGDGDSEVSIETLNGDVSICNK